MLRTLTSGLAVLLIVAPAFAQGDARRRIPFPVEKSTILREERVIYTVEGRQKIPKGVEISCQKDVHIVGAGPGAIIEVEGALRIHGVTDREVILEGITIEPAAEFLDIHLDMVWFRKGAALRTPEGVAVSGKLFVENVAFQIDAAMDVTFRHGSIDLSTVNSDVPIRVAAVNPEGVDRNKVKLKVRGCTEDLTGRIGLKGGLIVSGVDDATIRINRLGGEISSFTNCRKLIFDGNKVDSEKLEFHQPPEGDFRETTITKCDLYCETVTATSPVFEKKNLDRINLARCWYRGIEKPAEIREQVLRDGEKDPRNAARFLLGKIGSRPLELAGPWTR